MEHPFSPLFKYMLEAPMPTIPQGILRYNRGLDFNPDGDLRTTVDREYIYTWDEAWWQEYYRLYRECEEKERWTNEAKRAIFIADTKAEIRKARPVTKSFALSKVALTVSPAPDYQTPEHIVAIAQIVEAMIIPAKTGKEATIKSGAYVFEQRSKPGEEVHGWHIHFSVDTTYAPSKIKQFVCDRLKRQGYDCQFWATPDDGGFRDKYMQGIKNHASKIPKVQKDFVEREKAGLQHFYEF